MNTIDDLSFMEFDIPKASLNLLIKNNILLNTIIDLLVEIKAVAENKEVNQVNDEVDVLLESNRLRAIDLLKTLARQDPETT